VLQADRGEIEIMLNNLVSNAVKYNRDGGRVDVTLSGGVEGVTMAVKDTGIGMTKEETAKLFGEFVRIKNTKTRNIMGSGLGLSILRKLANMYGGEVTVESQPDVGTTFTVRLPAGAAHNILA
jgi:signal transduction histidine kinase